MKVNAFQILFYKPFYKNTILLWDLFIYIQITVPG